MYVNKVLRSTGEVGVVHSGPGVGRRNLAEEVGVRGRRAFRSCRERGEEGQKGTSGIL